MRSKVFSRVADMCPNELYGIEFRSTSGKGVNVQTRFSLDKVLDQASLMNGMVIPDQDNRTHNVSQELFEEQDHVLTTQIHSKRSHRQLYLSTTRTDQESTQQIQSAVVVQAGVGTRRLATRRPTLAQWRNH